MEPICYRGEHTAKRPSDSQLIARVTGGVHRSPQQISRYPEVQRQHPAAERIGAVHRRAHGSARGAGHRFIHRIDIVDPLHDLQSLPMASGAPYLIHTFPIRQACSLEDARFHTRAAISDFAQQAAGRPAVSSPPAPALPRPRPRTAPDDPWPLAPLAPPSPPPPPPQRLLFTGTSTYALGPDGLVTRHIDTWLNDRPPTFSPFPPASNPPHTHTNPTAGAGLFRTRRGGTERRARARARDGPDIRARKRGRAAGRGRRARSPRGRRRLAELPSAW